MIIIPDKKKKSQELFKQKAKSFGKTTQTPRLRKRKFLLALHELTPFQKDLLNVIREKSKVFGYALYFSHQYLADQVGCSIKTVQRALNHFEKIGFIGRQRNNHQTDFYRVCKWLFNWDIMKKVKHIFPFICVSFLMAQPPQVSPIKKRSYSYTVKMSTNMFIQYPLTINSLFKSDSEVSDARVREEVRQRSKKNRQGKMNTEQVVNAIKEIKSLSGMDKHDMHSLTYFDEEVIRETDRRIMDRLRKGRGPADQSNPVGYFASLARTITREENKQINYTYYKQLKPIIDKIDRDPDHKASFTEFEVEQVSPSKGKTQSRSVSPETEREYEQVRKQSAWWRNKLDADKERLKYETEHEEEREKRWIEKRAQMDKEPRLRDFLSWVLDDGPKPSYPSSCVEGMKSIGQVMAESSRESTRTNDMPFDVPQIPKHDNNYAGSGQHSFISDNNEPQEI